MCTFLPKSCRAILQFEVKALSLQLNQFVILSKANELSREILHFIQNDSKKDYSHFK